MQDQFLETQERTSDVVSSAYGAWINRKARQVLQEMSPSELEAERAQLMHFISTLDMENLVSEVWPRSPPGLSGCRESLERASR
jgi:hypothetical protein